MCYRKKPEFISRQSFDVILHVCLDHQDPGGTEYNCCTEQTCHESSCLSIRAFSTESRILVSTHTNLPSARVNKILGVFYLRIFLPQYSRGSIFLRNLHSITYSLLIKDSVQSKGTKISHCIGVAWEVSMNSDLRHVFLISEK